MTYLRITRKGQMTIPVKYRKKYNLRESSAITFKETEEGLLIVPVPDICDSAGSLSKYGDVEELLAELKKSREESFR